MFFFENVDLLADVLILEYLKLLLVLRMHSKVESLDPLNLRNEFFDPLFHVIFCDLPLYSANLLIFEFLAYSQGRQGLSEVVNIPIRI